MSIITTYVCDATGVTGNKEDFVEVEIKANPLSSVASYERVVIKKILHKDAAKKLNLVVLKKDEPVVAELTFEAKLKALITPMIEEIAGEAGAEAASNYLANR